MSDKPTLEERAREWLTAMGEEHDYWVKRLTSLLRAVEREAREDAWKKGRDVGRLEVRAVEREAVRLSRA